MRGQRPISLRCKTLKEAQTAAAEARLEDAELAAKAQLLTADAVQRLTHGKRVSAGSAAVFWKEWLEGAGLAPATIFAYTGTVARFLDEQSLRGASATAVSETHVRAFVNPAGDKLSANSRRMRLNALKSFTGYCASKGFTHGDPAKLVRVHEHELTHEQLEARRRKPVTDEHLSKLVVFDPFWRCAIALARNYGLRLGDAAQLEWASFNEAGRFVWYPDKTRRRMEAEVTPEVREILDSQPRTGRYVFPERAEIAKDPNRRGTLSSEFGRMLKAAGLHGLCFHGIRHGFATKLAGETQDLSAVSSKLGHRSTETTKIYVHA